MNTAEYRETSSRTTPLAREVGRLVSANSGLLEVIMQGLTLGERVTVDRSSGAALSGIVTGFHDGRTTVLPLGETRGLELGATVRRHLQRAGAPDLRDLRGRVLGPDGADLAAPGVVAAVPHTARRLGPLDRQSVGEQLCTGYRVIDTLMPLVRGQRVGIFAGSGVGKTTLMTHLAQRLDADLIVVALVGERAREVGEFYRLVQRAGIADRMCIIAATSDAAPMERVAAAERASAVAAQAADDGAQVVLFVDSVTRYARALRDVALLCGEAPARRGYPASVFSRLPQLIEEAGGRRCAHVTALYTVLVEGGEMEEPIADELRGLVDGHWVLRRSLAERGHFPAIDGAASVSRLAAEALSHEEARLCSALRAALQHRDRFGDAIAMGVYDYGADPRSDALIDHGDAIDRFLRQARPDSERDATFAELEELMEGLAPFYSITPLQEVGR